jgi:hypothetical protein
MWREHLLEQRPTNKHVCKGQCPQTQELYLEVVYVFIVHQIQQPMLLVGPLVIQIDAIRINLARVEDGAERGHLRKNRTAQKKGQSNLQC